MLEVESATRKAETAPTSIMPSTPTLMTPDRSVSSSPRPASTSGVPAATAAARARSMAASFMRCLLRAKRHCAAPPNQPIGEEYLGADHKDEERPLEHGRYGARKRHAGNGLQGVRRIGEASHQEGHRHAHQGMIAAEAGHDDSGNAT